MMSEQVSYQTKFAEIPDVLLAGGLSATGLANLLGTRESIRCNFRQDVPSHRSSRRPGLAQGRHRTAATGPGAFAIAYQPQLLRVTRKYRRPARTKANRRTSEILAVELIACAPRILYPLFRMLPGIALADAGDLEIVGRWNDVSETMFNMTESARADQDVTFNFRRYSGLTFASSAIFFQTSMSTELMAACSSPCI